jgi:hypothetical protein
MLSSRDRTGNVLRGGCLLASLLAGFSLFCLSQAAEAEPRDSFRTRLGISPDRRFEVEFAHKSNDDLVYRWIQRNPRRTLLEIKSTYQFERDAQGHLYKDKLTVAKDVAGISWSPDSRILAVDEAVLRMSGTVLVAIRPGPDTARQVVIPDWEIRQATGQNWARARLWLREDGAPITKSDIDLTLAGWVFDKSKAQPETEAQLHYTCFIKLHLGPLLQRCDNQPTYTIESCKQLSAE